MQFPISSLYLQKSKDVAEQKRQLEQEHQEVLRRLQEKQSEITMLSLVSADLHSVMSSAALPFKSLLHQP